MATFERICTTFLETLQKEKNLDAKQIDWITRQASLYKLNKNLHTPSEIALLDQLTPLLGYDWRDSNTYIEFNKIIAAVEERLTRGKNLLPYQINWLTMQRYTLLNEPNNPQNESKIKSITKATIPLDYDWKIGKKRTTFNTYYQSILDGIDHTNELSSSQKQWLSNQRKRYTTKENIPLDQMVKLGTLIDKLHLDWARERETYMRKKQIKRWLKKFYSCIDRKAIEYKIGIPIGTLDILHSNRLNTANVIDSPYISVIHDFMIEIQYTTSSKEEFTEQQQIALWIKRNYYFLNPQAIENTVGIPKEILEEIYLTQQVREQWVLPVLTYIKIF